MSFMKVLALTRLSSLLFFPNGTPRSWPISAYLLSSVEGGRSGCSFMTSVEAPVGHLLTHNPQPIHLARSTFITRSPSTLASIWHRSMQVPHFVHFDSSTAA